MVEPELERIGVPLVLACCPDLVARMRYQVAGHAVPQGNADHHQLAAQLSKTFLVEYDLWMRAGEKRIPYPLVYWALQHFRKPKAKPGHASLCVRCGELLTHYTRKRTTAALRCRLRAKDRSAPRSWPSAAPERAFAPMRDW